MSQNPIFFEETLAQDVDDATFDEKEMWSTTFLNSQRRYKVIMIRYYGSVDTNINGSHNNVQHVFHNSANEITNQIKLINLPPMQSNIQWHVLIVYDRPAV